ncbi:hypothetical protein N200_07880 [Helicobacter pylori UM065]|nr:hypothetical protein N200_07880 [Helicobacter pylori UM065]
MNPLFFEPSFLWGFDLFLFADPHYFHFLIFKVSFLGGFDAKPFLVFLVSGKLGAKLRFLKSAIL